MNDKSNKYQVPRPIRAALAGIFVLAVSYIYVYQAEPFPEPWTDVYLNMLIVLPSILAAGLAWGLVRLFRPEDSGPRWVWRWFALALSLWAVAEIAWFANWLITADVPTPSVADVFWVLALLPFGAAFIQQYKLIYHPPRQEWLRWLSVAVVGVALLTLGGGRILLRSTHDAALTSGAAYLEVFYTAADIAMLIAGIILARIFGRGVWGRAWWGLLAFVLSDGMYSYFSFSGLYAQSIADGNYFTLIVDLIYALAYQLMALAIWSQYRLVRYGPSLIPQKES
jgi:hypothetical protein